MAPIKFSDTISFDTLKRINLGKVVSQLDSTHRPMLLTKRGIGIAVIQSLDDFEVQEEEQEFLKALLNKKI